MKSTILRKTASSALALMLTCSSASALTAINLSNISAKTTAKTAKKATKKKKNTKKTPAVYLSAKSKTLYTGSSYTLYLKNNKKKVTWTASSTKVSLSSKKTGSVKVTAKKAGTSTVTAKIGSKKYSCAFTIKTKTKTTSKKTTKTSPTPKLSAKSKTIYVGESFTLKSDIDIEKWYSDDEDIAVISHKTKRSVTVTGKNNYEAYIYAKTAGNKYAWCHVTVKVKKEKSDEDDNLPPTDTTLNIASHYSQAGVDAYNAMRAKYGLPPLKRNPELDPVAVVRANEITTKLDHISVSHAIVKYENAHSIETWVSVNESLATAGYAPGKEADSAKEAIHDLMQDAHRKMILDPEDHYVSAALAVHHGTAFWVFLSEKRGDEVS